MLTVGQKIRKMRELRNYTQEFMAQELNMSPQGYSKIERDEVEVNYSKLEKIAEVLKINILNLLSFDEKQIFNVKVNHNHQLYNGSNINNPEDKSLYDKIIINLEAENKYLKENIIKYLEAENQDLKEKVNHLEKLLEQTHEKNR